MFSFSCLIDKWYASHHRYIHRACARKEPLLAVIFILHENIISSAYTHNYLKIFTYTKNIVCQVEKYELYNIALML